MKTNINKEVLESIVPITDLNRGYAAKVIDTLTDESAEKIIVRNNKPVAVLVSVDRYLELVDKKKASLETLSMKEIKVRIAQFCKSNHTYGEAIQQVYLFGSYARNEATHKSDIDILIDIDKEKINSNVKNMALMSLATELGEYFGKEVDVIYTSYIPEKLKKNIMEDKVLIYG